MTNCGPCCLVGIAADCGLDGPGTNPGGVEKFPPLQTGYIPPTVPQTRKPVRDIVTSLWISRQQYVVQILTVGENFVYTLSPRMLVQSGKASEFSRSVTVSENGPNIE